MNYIKVNGFDLPIIKKDKSIFTYSLCGVKYSFKKEGVSEVLYVDAKFTYETNYYYNLFDSKGNIIKEDKHRETENLRDIVSINDVLYFGGKKIILFINGEFKLLTVNNNYINTIDEISEFNHILNSTYKTYSDVNRTPFDYEMDYVPHYNIIRGHSRVIFGIFSRKTIQMTYKELKSKIKTSKELYKSEVNDIDKDFEDIENEIVNSLSKYLMLTPKQYKIGRFNLINQLNKRLNYNINNKK